MRIAQSPSPPAGGSGHYANAYPAYDRRKVVRGTNANSREFINF